MEDKIGYAVIKIDDYKEMIVEDKEKDEMIKILKMEIEEKEEQLSNIKNKIKQRIYKSSDYEFRVLEILNDKLDIKNYNYRELENDFYELGITDKDEIYSIILELYNKKQEEINNKEEE